MSETKSESEKPEGVIGADGQLRDPKTGRLMKGTKGGKGAPKGYRRADVLAICRRLATEDAEAGLNGGMDLDRMLWAMFKGMMVKASNGNARCAKIVLDYLAVVPEHLAKGPHINVDVDVDARQVNAGTGPPMPSGVELGQFLKTVNSMADDLITVEIIDEPTLEERDALEDFLE